MIKCFFLFAAMVASASGWAQSPVVLKDSGLKKLAVFVGTWKAGNDPDSMGKSPVVAISACQWSPNGNYLICDQQVTNQGTTSNNLSIYTRNADKDGYTLTVNTFLSSTNYTFKVQSSEDGEHWTTSMQGKSTKIR